MKRLWKTLTALLRQENNVRDNEDGQIVVFTALSGLALVTMVATIFNVGMVTGEKMSVQNAADAAAYSQAVAEARVLNFLAYTNRAIISHMVTIAFTTAILSQRELWEKISLIAASIPGPGWAIAPTAQTLFRIWDGLSRIARPVRREARAWLDMCRDFQFAAMSEYLGNANLNRMAKRIGNSIDPTLHMIPQDNDAIGGVASFANAVEFRNLTGYPSPRVMDFKSLREVYKESMDGFSKGSSFPRGVDAPVYPLFKIGLGGKIKIEPDSLTQSEHFFVGVSFACPDWWGFIDWCYEKSIPIAGVTYRGLQLGSFKMYNAQTNAVRGDNSSLSVVSFAQKNSRDVAQIPLLGAATDRNISAFAHAEVFYWDPDRQRSRQLQKFNPPREPNLFNPFWHARLAPAEEALPFLPSNLFNYLPITH